MPTVLSKSKGVLVASALALAAAGGSVPAARAESTGPLNTAPSPATPSASSLTAARRAITSLPHSPRLLNQLAGPGRWRGKAASAGPTSATVAAALAGLDVAAYHFAIPNVSSGPQQAAYAGQHSGYQPGAQTLPLTLDIEYDPYSSSDGTNECYGLSPARMVAWISGFASTARSLTGQDPIIYTTADWWGACTGGSTVFGADPMWVAAYGFSRPPLPAGWTTYSYWQYTSGGTVPGVDSPGTTDLDTFSPSAVALIDPGTLASRPLARVTAAIQSLGALAGENLTWTASGLPPGLGITALGVLTGVITNPPANEARSPVTYEPTVTARNAAGGASTVTFDWQVAATCPDYLTFSVCPGR